MKDDWNILLGMAGGYQDVGLGVWALTEIISQARERLNEGKTAPHQRRHNDHDPLYNYKLGRAGIFGEVMLLIALKEAGASEETLKYIQAGLLHQDIRLAEHKGAADVALRDDLDTLRLLDVKTSRFMNITGADGRLKINCRKHSKLIESGLDAYIGIAAPDYSTQAYILNLITPQQVESWAVKQVDKKGNNFYEAEIGDLIAFPATFMKARLHRHMYSADDVTDLAFNNDEFGDTIRSAFPHINWSLV